MTDNQKQLERVRLYAFRGMLPPPQATMLADIRFLVGLVDLLHQVFHERTGDPMPPPPLLAVPEG